MARYDKYDPISGGFRAPLAADFTTVANFGKVYAVGLNASGQVVIGGGASGVVGVMVLTSARFAGDAVDVMTHGEIVDLNLLTPFDNFAAAPVAGTKYYGVVADGTISTVAAANAAIGWTVESKRLIVRLGNRAVGA